MGTPNQLIRSLMHALKSTDGMHAVLLGAKPTNMQLLDGQMGVSTGTATMVCRALKKRM